MAQSYTRQSTFADGDTITAALFNDEYNQLLNAFAYSNTSAASTGHRHDGTAGEGGNIHTIGDLDFNNKIVVDDTNNRWGFYVEVSSAAVEQIRIQDGAMIPVTDSDVDLGTSSLYWKDAYIDSVTTTGNISIGGNLTVTGNATISGNLTFGDADTDSITLTADVASHITPDTDDTYDLGSSTKEWRDIYIDGTAYLDAINFNGTAITATAAELNIMDGVTSTTAELNILDGVTATATELNIMDGDTAATSTTLADADRVVVNDAGTMKQVALTDFETYFESAIDTINGNLTITGDLTISGDDLVMATNTAGHLLIADGTNFNPTAVGDLSEITTIANDDVLLAVDTSGGGLKKVTRATLTSGILSGSEISNIVEDTTPQLGGDLDVNGNGLVSTSNGNIAITPNGTGLVRLDGNVDIQSGEIVLKNSGSVSNIKFYCEVSNAHYTQLQSAAHADYSGNVTLTLPASTDTLVGRATTDTLTNKRLTSPKINEDVVLSATATELNVLDGITSTTAELNILDGVTSTAAELNLVDGSSAGTIVNSKAVVYGSSGEVNATTLQIAGTSITSTAAELNILDGVTSTAAELNILDGVTATTAELNILDGVTATATELNILDGVTATTAELNYTDGVTSNIQTQLDAKVGANYTGDVDITGELLVDSYNETFKKLSTTATFTFNISNTTYDSKTVATTSQDTTGNDIFIKPDGTSMYIIGDANNTVYQYTLSTAWDVSTASYASKSFSVGSQNSFPHGIHFKSDGTKMYMLGGATVYQYSLSTAWDVSTASYDSVSHSTSSEATDSKSLRFKPDGTKMYVLTDPGATTTIWQYSLSTAWDLSTTSYDSVSLVISSQDADPLGMDFNDDGTKLYVVGAHDDIREWTLSTAYSLSTASYNSTAGAVEMPSAGNNISGVFFKSDDSEKFYITDLGTTSQTHVRQYTPGSTSYASTLNCENANVFEIVLEGSTTITFSNPPAAGTATDSTAYAMSLKVVQDSGASGYTITWPTSVDWPSATAPTLTATASAVDQFVFYTYTGGTTWYGFTAGQALG